MTRRSPVRLTTSKLIVATAVFLVGFDNTIFFQNVASVYPLAKGMNLVFIASLALGVTAFTAVLLALFASLLPARPALALLLVLAAGNSYFMGRYHVVIDYLMVQNILQTNVREAMDLFSLKLLLYLLLLGIMPALAVLLLPFERQPLARAALSRLKLIGLCLLVILCQLFPLGRFYASFFREHKELRDYVNPTFAIYSVHKYLRKNFGASVVKVQPIGTDARIQEPEGERELIIVVVGESARADRFSLDGYSRQTNPRLSREGVMFYPHVQSCDTSTATSVPCMFSNLSHNGFSNRKARSRENILDVALRAGANVLWRDNNSDSKGVALRVPYEDYQSPDKNPVCDEECRDEGMLPGLQEYIDSHQEGDILIILHQMGNHGPAYYKRYPPAFERFTPVCRTNQLDECSEEEINNAYDNAILYTDYFLSQVIALLKQNDDRFETAMLYMGDHGESLGEMGVYLHGLPYLFAPEAQTHIPAILWLGRRLEAEVDLKTIRNEANREYSHDNLFHTLLGLLEIRTEVYNSSLDMLHDAYTEVDDQMTAMERSPGPKRE